MKTDTGNALGLPPIRGEEVSRYVITARSQRTFHTILDAHQLLDPARTHLAVVTTRVTHDADGGRVELRVDQDLRGGAVVEELECEARPTLRSLRFKRSMVDQHGVECRSETVDFTRGPLRFPGIRTPRCACPSCCGGSPSTASAARCTPGSPTAWSPRSITKSTSR